MSLPYYFNVLSPFQGEVLCCCFTGGYATLTPGYYHITPYGVSIRIPPGSYNDKDARIARLYIHIVIK